MLSTQCEIAEKISEAEIHLRLVEDLSKQHGSVVTVSILKSAHLLILYNTLESVTRTILEQVHEIASREKYGDLCDPLRKIWANYYFSKHREARRYVHLEGTLSGTTKFPLYSEYIRHTTPFSGNLDGRLISKILQQYGIGRLDSVGREKLVEIKNKRNRIAHGEEMFKESCRNYSLQEMAALQSACFNAVTSIVSQTEIYLNEKKYLS